MVFDARVLFVAMVLCLTSVVRGEPIGSVFSYQGYLTDNGTPMEGSVDLRFSLWDDQAAGAQAGADLATTATASEGRFIVDLDFGFGPFGLEQALWLEIEVSTNGGSSWTTLSARHRLNPVPFAVRAENAAYSASTNGLTVDPSGKIGIGTATPGYRLTIDQPGHGFSHIWDPGSGEVDVTTFVNGSGGWIGTRNPNPLYFYTNDSAPRATLDTFGRFGIGTQSPQSRLDVRDLTAGGTAVRVSQNGSGDTVGVDSVVITGVGVRGEAQDPGGTSYGVLGVIDPSSTGWGVFSQGRIGASGTKSFVIDHPLEPANKLLLHYSSEAPEPLNTYSGTVVLDSAGRAVIQLPNYFESINTDYRYQLTAIGGAAPSLHVASEVQGNAFAVAGGAAGLKVSWEVTARRNDAFVRLKGSPRELLKAPGDRGKYLLPEAYGGGNAQRMNTIERIEEN